MITRKTLNLRSIYLFAGHHLVWLSAWMAIVTTLYYFTHWKWITIPWLPISVIGTAVAFYVGFKNNQAYDRLWEGRKIWGSMINSSRMWGSMVRSYIQNDKINPKELIDIKRQLIYRHIAYLYTLREQLLAPTQWEHVSLGWRFGTFNQKRREAIGDGAFKDDISDLKKYMSNEELHQYKNAANKATQMIDTQSQMLNELLRNGSLEMMKMVELQKVLNDFYDHQGKAERIKKFPLPRQYGSFSFIFVCIFIFLLPFGIVSEFSKLGDYTIWLAIPFGTIVGWIYVVMELIGDYSENPFEGLYNDVPMLSICRTIEIDLLQMLQETNIPKPISARNNILM